MEGDKARAEWQGIPAERDRRLQGTGEIKRKGNEHLFLVLDLGRGGAGLLLLVLGGGGALCRNI